MPEPLQKIQSFYQSRKRMPSYAELATLFGFKSKNAAHKFAAKLIDEGIMFKDRLGKLLPGKLMNEVPMVGLVKAGLPADATELTDSIDLESYLVPKKDSTYLFEVDGDSMIEAHIEDGDIVIAEKTQNAKVGDIVIARVDGEFTMKYLRKEGSRMYLQPANKKYKNIYPEHELVIVAVVKGVVRKY